MLLAFVAGAVVGAGGLWYYQQEANKGPLEKARDSVTGTVDRVKSAMSEIRTEDIKRELERGGMVVREKVTRAGQVISDATADARTTAAIKAKLLKEPGLSSLSISVDTTDGLVTLSGTAGSHEEIAKAVKLALETDGVKKVVSTIQVRAGK